MTTVEFALPNVGPGPDPLSLADLDADFAVLLLHRDFYCSECRQQVRRVKGRYDEFETRDVEVVSVLPDDRDTAEQWQKQYHLPFPVVADPDATLGDRFGQQTRFGLLGKVHDVIGRMPATVVLDIRGDDPEEVFGHRGTSKADRPRIDDVLEAVDKAAGSAPPATGDVGTGEASPADGPVPEDGGAEVIDEDVVTLPPGYDLPEGVSVRRADEDDVMSVLRVLHGALLDIESDRVREAIADGEAIVAEDRGWVVGALVLDGNHVEAVAVRRERRTEGLGAALVEAAARDVDEPLTADFRAGVRGFWEALGFDVERDGNRLWGERAE